MSKAYLDADPGKANQGNNIIAEELTNVYADILKALNHDIFYAEGLLIYSNINNKEGSLLQIDADYTLESKDDESTSLAGKDCYRRLKFNGSYTKLYADYWAYGDLITGSIINDINTRLNSVETNILDGGTF
jgi:hypothetical protein